jgi:hypothetical protein
MVKRSIAVRVLAVALSFFAVTMTVPFAPAEAFSASPLGTVVASANVMVGNAIAPTGTTIFAGDRVTSDSSALISLTGGSRVEMTKAAATFNREGNTLVMQAKEGLLRFNFVKGENVQINAGKYTFTSANSSAHVGELGLNSKGEIIMFVGEGTFTALNNVTGVRSQVSPSSPIVAIDQKGKATGAAAMGAAAASMGSGKASGFYIPLELLALIGMSGTITAVGVFEATASP